MFCWERFKTLYLCPYISFLTAMILTNNKKGREVWVLRVFSALIKKEKNKITDKIVSSSSFESFKFPQ